MKTNIITAIGLLLVIIWYVFILVPKRDEANNQYWSEMTKKCQAHGGILTTNGCEIN